MSSGHLTNMGKYRAVAAALGDAASAVAGAYLGLLTALPASPETVTLATFNATELTTAGYARKGVTWATSMLVAGTHGNSSDLSFGPFTANPPAVNAVFLCTAVSGTTGDVLAYWSPTFAIDATTNDTIDIAAGDLTMTVD
jgi:hypothetical protein